jgi:ATP-dependent DNA ligase
MAFDLLYFDGRDLTGTELSARRQLLEEVNPFRPHGLALHGPRISPQISF